MKKDIKKSSLLDKWKNKDKKKYALNTVKKAPLNAKIPLSYGQKRLWFLQQMYPDNVFYNLSESYTFEGKLNINYLKDSLNTIFEKHQILKSYYDVEDGKPILKIDTSISLKIHKEDFSNYTNDELKLRVESYMDKQAHFSFSLSSSPLFIASILKLNENTHILLLTFHHIISDQWSMGILRNEIAFNYKQLSEGLYLKTEDSSISFEDYAYWQNTYQTFDNQIIYWKDKLSGDIPLLDLPIDFKRPITPSYQGNDLTFKFSKETSSLILNLAKKLEVTPFVLFLTAYYLLLNNFTKQEDILIGTPVSNRNHKQLENVFGLFIDTIVLRTSIKETLSISQFIKEVRNTFTEALSNKDIPFDILVKELNVDRSLAINPFFQAMFVYTSKQKLPSFGENLELIENSDYIAKVSKFDLTLFITEQKGEISSTFEYASDLFELSTIERFQKYLQHVLEYIVKNTDNTISKIPVLTKDDEALLKQNNSTIKNPFQDYTGIHNIIEDIAKKHPNNIALSFEEQSITYKTLNHKANIVAQELIKHTQKKNSIVGLCVERSLDMIIGMLGILKAGCAYLPIDSKYPIKRIEFMLKDAKVDNIITQSSLLSLYNNFDIKPILINEISYSNNIFNIELPIVKEADIAYLIYTSGSTGQPKGVPITHKNIINSTGGRLDFYNNSPSAFLLMSSISFDSSKAGIFWTLSTGGNLIITKKRIEQDIEEIAKTIEQYKVSHTLMLPSLYNVILENVETNKLKSLTTVMVAGEACPKSLCETHFNTMPNVSLYNEYGPTEATVWCIAHKIEPKDLKKEQIPIGKPVTNAQIHILNNDIKKVPLGVAGEIYIGGIGLTKGYLNRLDLTNNAFIDNPFIPGKKLYKTGDLARYNNNGTIDFLGRVDQQIKIRGFRVELDDIENTINKNSFVKQAIVLVKQNEGKPKSLIAYIKPHALFNEQQLKFDLKETLPDYMIPNSIVLIKKIPLLPNGKVDKKSLSKIEVISKPINSEIIQQPKNAIEQKLLDIWKNILNIESLRTTDNFFEVGGDSILSIQIIAKARKEGIKIAPNQIFEHQTISELAMFVSSKDENITNSEVAFFGETPLTPIQKWFFDTHKNAPEYWNQGFEIKDLPESTNKNTLKETTDILIKTHDALRLSFSLKNDKWSAYILKPEEIDAFCKVDISDEIPSNHNSKINDILKSMQEVMKLEKGSLFKCIYFDTGSASDNVLVILAHHLIIDFVSWQIILNEYTEVIHSKKTDGNGVFKTSSYNAWANHLSELSFSENMLNELHYWKNQISYKNDMPLDFECERPFYKKDIQEITIKIDSEFSESTFNKINEAYNTKTDELLLTAFITVLSAWSKKEKIAIALERHGRETGNTTIDLSSSIGWFTSFFPQLFNLNSCADIGASIIKVKEQMRNIPNGGIGYGVLRYLNPKLESTNYPDIVFNFLGKQSTGKNNIQFISNNTRHSLSERHYFLEVNSLVKNGILEMSWNYAHQALKKETVEFIIIEFRKQLQMIIEHCLLMDTKKYTPSDFQDIDLDQDDLDSLLNDLDL